MLNVITSNPFRILGVYANSAQKEIIANKGRITAFAKVNRAVNFPLDLNSILPTIERSVDAVNQALSSIALPAEKLKNAMFWFVNVTSIDKVAFNHITNGNFNNGLDIWEKANDWSSLHNRIICYLIEGKVDKVGIAAQKLYGSYPSAFLQAIGCDNLNYSGTQLMKLFVDILFEQKVDVTRLISSTTSSEMRNYINDKSIAPLIDFINKEIAITSNTRGKDGSLRYKSGLALKNNTSSYLASLKSKLGVENVQYQMIADKLAQEILQCGIDYYNDSPMEKVNIDMALILQQYACDISVGRISKERCLENVQILKKQEKEAAIKEDIDAIVKALNQFDIWTSHENNKSSDIRYSLAANNPDFFVNDIDISEIRRLTKEDEIHKLNLMSNPFYNVKYLIDECSPHLLNIKQTLGSNNQLYLDISSTVVRGALNELIEVLNEIQKIVAQLRNFSWLYDNVKIAEDLMNKMAKFDMHENVRSYLDENRSSLRDLKSNVIRIINSRPVSPSSNSGCCVALAIAIVLSSIPFFLF